VKEVLDEASGCLSRRGRRMTSGTHAGFRGPSLSRMDQPKGALGPIRTSMVSTVRIAFSTMGVYTQFLVNLRIIKLFVE